MAGHRKTRGNPITLIARVDQRRDHLARATADAPTARHRATLAWNYFRAALASTDRNRPAEAAEACDRAAALLRLLGDELYDAAVKDRRATR